MTTPPFLQLRAFLAVGEFERGRRTRRAPVRGGLVVSDTTAIPTRVGRGVGLAYAPETLVRSAVRAARLKVVLEAYAPKVPGYFLYFPSRSRSSAVLRAFVDTAKALAARGVA